MKEIPKNRQPKQPKKKSELKKLADQPKQLSFFKELSQGHELYSTKTLRLWDSLIGVVFDDSKNRNRIEGKFLDIDVRRIILDDQIIKVTRIPSRVVKNDVGIDYFPSKRDYKVFELLVKLAIDKKGAEFFLDKKNKVLTLEFSFYEIHSLYKKLLGTEHLSHAQLKDSIEVLKRADMILESDRHRIDTSIITEYILEENKKDESKSKIFISFSSLFSRLILSGRFREANLYRILYIKDLFTIFLYKKFVNNFTQASLMNNYHFSLNSVLKEYPTIDSWKVITRKIEKVCKSLNELKGDVITTYDVERRYSDETGQKKTIDCIFTVHFTPKFVVEQKRANGLNNKSIVIDETGKILDAPKFKDYQDKEEYLKDLTDYYNKGKKLFASKDSETLEGIFSQYHKKDK